MYELLKTFTILFQIRPSAIQNTYKNLGHNGSLLKACRKIYSMVKQHEHKLIETLKQELSECWFTYISTTDRPNSTWIEAPLLISCTPCYFFIVILSLRFFDLISQHLRTSNGYYKQTNNYKQTISYNYSLEHWKSKEERNCKKNHISLPNKLSSYIGQKLLILGNPLCPKNTLRVKIRNFWTNLIP